MKRIKLYVLAILIFEFALIFTISFRNDYGAAKYKKVCAAEAERCSSLIKLIEGEVPTEYRTRTIDILQRKRNLLVRMSHLDFEAMSLYEYERSIELNPEILP